MNEPSTHPGARDRIVMQTLQSIRALSDAMDRMNNGMKGDMDMNASDLAALRMLIVREQRGESVSPHDIAHHLRISTASTTKLLDRLASTGHIVRVPHPRDRRARVVQLTEKSKREFFRRFRERLQSMKDVAQDFSDEELLIITHFMDDLGTAIDPRE